MIYHTLSKSGDSGEKRSWNLLHILQVSTELNITGYLPICCAAGHQNRPCVLRLLRPSICAAARIFPSGGPRSSPGSTEVRTSAENTKSAGGIASVSAFAFDGTSIERFGQSVKCQTVFF